MKHKNTFNIQCGVAQSQGSRDFQEDKFNITKDHWNVDGYALFGVFDGHGTDAYSEHASQKMFSLITQSKEFQEGRYENALSESFLKENNEMQELLKYEPKGGTTATVVFLNDSELYVANVGDSRSVLAEKHNGKLIANRVSKDHSLEDRNERKRIKSFGGTMTSTRVIAGNSRINMSKALGDFDFKQPRNNVLKYYISYIRQLEIGFQQNHFLIESHWIVMINF